MNLEAEFRNKLSEKVVSLLREIGTLAGQMGMTAYAVGGFVRDLILGTPTLDVDIVVEGDSVALAYELARMWGAKLTVHQRFLTATLRWESPNEAKALTLSPPQPYPVTRLDIATARMERYPEPAILPEVEPATLLDDLLRRDFSINAMAVCLEPNRFGELLDPTGGYRDLQSGVVRVLHDRSFVDDPTRIFRAVRYEQRFGFRIEPKTLRLIRKARDESLLTRLTRDRIKQELWRTLREREPVKPMRRLKELGILTVIAPELSATPKRLDWMGRVNRWLQWFESNLPDKRLEREWALLLPLLPNHEAVISFCQRYQLGQWERESAISLFKAAKRRTPKRPSKWVQWLNPSPLEVALVIAAKRANQNEPIWQRYFSDWRWARPDISGEDLKAYGLSGRTIAIGLQAALEAKLDMNADATVQLKVALRKAKP
ncbi:MAG: CCA tRNA nucleotidyltransferase [Candidatus Fervidibacter sp.]|uniref:CCA tRNA nucleotidyltransferase n=1 Tax=Candidatus Fervidibacter sp. TaxID=3100871 RepID=UPI0040495BE2